uniref:Tr-type G domain-containing protein n=1 Tax=Strongyloides papillosus TaxID=174720 RepID=A0A0N5C9B8_STREA
MLMNTFGGGKGSKKDCKLLRILQLADVVDSRTKKAQVFDESQSDSLKYSDEILSLTGNEVNGYLVDPIDTLGHVDFRFEAARKFTSM